MTKLNLLDVDLILLVAPGSLVAGSWGSCCRQRASLSAHEARLLLVSHIKLAATLAWRADRAWRSSSECAKPSVVGAARMKFPQDVHVAIQQQACCLQKAATKRTAAASARIQLTPAAFEAVQTNSLKKGDVLTAAQIAGARWAHQGSDAWDRTCTSSGRPQADCLLSCATRSRLCLKRP